MSITITSTAGTLFRQRNRTTHLASIPVNGIASGENGNHVEARWNSSGAYSASALIAANAWSLTLTSQPQGMGTLEARVVETPSTTSTLADVGVGAVVLWLGQSNAVGMSFNPQSYSSTDGFKARYYGTPDTTDSAFGELSDSICSPNGSPRPLLATRIMNGLHVPVCFVIAAHSGQTVDKFLPSATEAYYTALVTKATTLGGAEHGFVWEGESDSIAGTSQASFNASMDTIANGLQSDLGITLTWAKLQQTGFGGDATINAAIAEAWGDNTNLPGSADLSSLVGLHPGSDADMAFAAQQFWDNAYMTSGLFATVFAGGVR